MYKIIAFVGEAGCGKDTLMQRVLAARPGRFNEIVSCTTRPMREGEAEGVNYFYFTVPAFKEKITNGDMLEYTIFNNWYYGTSINSLRSDRPNIGVFNPAGIYSMLNRKDIELTIFRVKCDNKNRLLRQLNRESSPDVDEIIRRYATDRDDFKNLDFNYIEIENNCSVDLEPALKKILSQLEDSGA